MVILLFSHSVMPDSLQPHVRQHAVLPWPSLPPRACSNSCPSSQWYHPTISSSIVLFFSILQSFPASRSFPVSQLFKSDGQIIGVSASASVLPKGIQDCFPLGWTGWISLLSKGLSRVFSNTTVQSINILVLRFLYGPNFTSIPDYWNNHSFDWTNIVGRVMSLFFNMLSRLVIAFFARSKTLLISWLQSPSAVILEPKKIKSVTVFVVAKNELDICRCPSLLDT